MNEKIDAGDIILKRKLSLKGTLNEIFDRMIINDFEIIEKIIQGKFKSKKQSGKPTTFKAEAGQADGKVIFSATNPFSKKVHLSQWSEFLGFKGNHSFAHINGIQRAHYQILLRIHKRLNELS